MSLCAALLRHPLPGNSARTERPSSRSSIDQRDAIKAGSGSLAAVASIAKGTFEIAMSPGTAEINGAVARLDFTKTWSGELEGVGTGVLLSCGDPQAGEAGYVAIETVEGRLGVRDGGFALQQLGSMHAGSQTLHYDVAPGSGRGALEGITGRLALTIDDDDTHRYELEYDL
jgi:hypothetical protein